MRSEPSTLERLAIRFRPDLPRRFTPREKKVEAISAALFLGCAVALALTLDSARTFGLVTLLGLIGFHAVCSHIRLYVGAGCAMPTQVALIVMLFWLPAGLVPLAVAGGLLLATAADVVARRSHPERMLSALGDSWHAVLPALVVAFAGEPGPHPEAWSVLAVALAFQITGDFAFTTLREWLGRGLTPTIQVQPLLGVAAVDVALAPIGLMAAALMREGSASWLLAAPCVLLLGALAQDRRRRIEEAVRRVEDLRRERDRLHEVLRGAGRAFAANLDREALLRAVADTAAEALAAEVGWAGRTPANEPPAAAYLTDDGLRLVQYLQRAVDEATRLGHVAITSADDWHVIACPLRAGRGDAEKIAAARRGEPFNDQDINLFAHLAAQAGVSMENADLHERLRVQAMVDELTGLANHRHLQEFLDWQLQTGQPLALILVDIDDFKAVNDEYGHQQGDEVLASVGAVVRGCFREVDEMARYGGEELAIAMPGAGLPEAEAAAERLRLAVQRLELPSRTGPVRVTISAGVAAYPDGANSKAELVSEADSALYAAKAAGKNRTVVARSAALGVRPLMRHA